MTTVNTVEDIIEVLDSDPLLLDALRARLLTRDLIELPQVVAELAASHLRLEATLHQFMETTDERLKELAANQQTLTANQQTLKVNQQTLAANQQTLKADQQTLAANQKELAANQKELAANQRIANLRLDGLEETQQTLVETQQMLVENQQTLAENQQVANLRLGGLENRMGSLEITVNGIRLDVDSMKGNHMEMQLQSKVHALLGGRMALRQVEIVRAHYPAGVLQSFIAAVYEAEETGLITERRYMRVLTADLIVSARRRGGGEVVYVAIEVSNKLDRHDVDRAAMTAESLAMAFPQTETLAAVYGREISDADRSYAESEGVDVFLDDSGR